MVKFQSFRQGPTHQKFLFLTFSRKLARGRWGAQSCSRRTEVRTAGYTRPLQRDAARETPLQAIQRLLVQGPSSKPKVQRLLTQLIKSSRSWQQLHHYLTLFPQYLNHIHYTAAFTHLTSLPSRSSYTPTTPRPPRTVRSPETTHSAKNTLLAETIHSTQSSLLPHSTKSAPASTAAALTGSEDATRLLKGGSEHGSPVDQSARMQLHPQQTPAANVAPDIAASRTSWPALGTEPGFLESSGVSTAVLPETESTHQGGRVTGESRLPDAGLKGPQASGRHVAKAAAAGDAVGLDGVAAGGGISSTLQNAALGTAAESQEDAVHPSSAWFVEPDSAQSSLNVRTTASESIGNLELPARPNLSGPTQPQVATSSEPDVQLPQSGHTIAMGKGQINTRRRASDAIATTGGTEGQYHSSMHEGTAGAQNMLDKAGFAAHLSSLVATQLDDVDARGLANILWAHAVLQTRPADCDKFLDACLSRMGEFSAQHLCNLMWAMASLQLLPSQEWLHAFLHTASASFSHCTLQGMSQMLWGLASLGIKPEASWLSSLCQSCLQRLEAHEVDDCIPQTVSMTLWSLAKLNGQPDPHLLDLYLDHLLSLGWSQCTSQCISNIAWALGTLHYTPSPAFSTSFLEATHQLLTNISQSSPTFPISNSTNISRSSPATTNFSGHSAPSPYNSAVSGFSEDNVLLLSNVGWAVATLQLQPSQAWMDQYAAACHVSMPSFSPQDFRNVAWSLVQLRYCPSAHWISHYLKHSLNKLDAFSPEGLALTSWSLARLYLMSRPPPPPAPPGPQASMSSTAYPSAGQGTTELNQVKTKISSPQQSSATAIAATAASSPTSSVVPGSVAAPMQSTPSSQTTSSTPTTAIHSALPTFQHSTAFPAPVQYLPTTDFTAATSLAAPAVSSAPFTPKSTTLHQLFTAAMTPSTSASLTDSPPPVTSTTSPPLNAPTGSLTGSISPAPSSRHSTPRKRGYVAAAVEPSKETAPSGLPTGSLPGSITESLAGSLAGSISPAPSSRHSTPRKRGYVAAAVEPSKKTAPSGSPTGSLLGSLTESLAGSVTRSISPTPSSRHSTPRKRGYVAAAVEPSKETPRTPTESPAASSPKLPTHQQPRPSPEQTRNLPRQVASQSLLAAVEDAFRIDEPTVKRSPLPRLSTSSSLPSSLSSPFSSLSASSSSLSSKPSSLAAPPSPSSLPVEQLVNGSRSSPVQLPNGVHVVDQPVNGAVMPPGQLVNTGTTSVDQANGVSMSVDQLVNKPSSFVDLLVDVTSSPVDHVVNGSSTSVSVKQLVSHPTASDRPSKRACTADAQTLQLPSIQQSDFSPDVPLHLLQRGHASYANDSQDSLSTMDGSVFTFVDDQCQIVNNSFTNGSQHSLHAQRHAVSISNVSDVEVNRANFNGANFGARPSKPDLQFGVQGDRVAAGGSAGMHSYVAFAFSVEYIPAGGEGGGALEDGFEIVQDRTETELGGGGIVDSRLAQSSNSVAVRSSNSSDSVAASDSISLNTGSSNSSNSVTTSNTNSSDSVSNSSDSGNSISSSTSKSSTDKQGNRVGSSILRTTDSSSTSNVDVVKGVGVGAGDPGSAATWFLSGSSSGVSDSNRTARPILVRPQKRADTDSNRSTALSGSVDETRQQVLREQTVVGSEQGQRSMDSGQFNTTTSTSTRPWGNPELLSSFGSRSRVAQSSDRALSADLVSNSSRFSDVNASFMTSAQSLQPDRDTVTSEMSTSYDTAANQIWTEAVSNWLRVVLRRVSRQWHCWSPRSLSMLIWAVAKTRHRPEGDWMQQFLLHSGPLLRNFNAQDLSNTIWALSLLRVQPEEQWLGSFQEASLQLAGSMRPQESCVILWSFASLKVPVSHSWLRTYLMSAVPLLNRFKPGDYAQCLWSLASLQHVPPSPWLSKLLDESWVQLPLFGPRDLSITIWSLAKVLQKRSLPKEWVHSFLTASTRQFGGFSCQAVVNTGWAVAVLRPACDAPVASAWLQRWLQRCHETAAELSPAGTCALMWTLYRLQHVPPQPWMQHVLDQVRPKLQEFAPNELAVLLWGIHQTGHHPDRTWLLAFFDAAQAQLHGFPTKPASLIANALAQFDVELNQRWLSCFVLVADDSIDQ